MGQNWVKMTNFWDSAFLPENVPNWPSTRAAHPIFLTPLYIGPDIDDDDDSNSEESDEEIDSDDDPALAQGITDEELALMTPDQLRDIKTLTSKQEKIDQSQNAMAVVLHEDKNYYPSHAQVYGPDVEIVIQEEDTQPITEPIIKPEIITKFSVTNAALEEVPKTVYRVVCLEC